MSHIIQTHLQALHTASRKGMKQLKPKQSWEALRPQNTATYRQARTAAEEPIVPHPSLFTSLEIEARNPDTSQSQRQADKDSQRLPVISECAVHLELLEVFHALRQDVLQSSSLDKAFGLQPQNKTVYRKRYNYRGRYVNEAYQLADPTWASRRLEKWSYFLDIAARRFLRWAPQINDTIANAMIAEDSDSTMLVEIPFLPPLDVLMVWHAFLLNPKDFREYCQNNSLEWLKLVQFPWRHIHACIESRRKWAFQLPTKTQNWLQETMKLDPDLFTYLINLTETGAQPVPEQPITDDSSSCFADKLSSLLPTKGRTLSEETFSSILKEALTENSLVTSLVGNVERQGDFVDKMHALLWIRSPAVDSTIRRAIERYDCFLQLFRTYPGRTLVPTLDIDLAWHTHQLSPEQYATAIKFRTGRFINHDDKLSETTLNNGQHDTEALFQISFGRSYEVCLCWDCEAMAAAIESTDGLDSNNQSPGASDSSERAAQRLRADVDYYRALELARRDPDAKLPLRN